MNSLETVKWLLCSANFCQSEAAWRIFQAQEITRASIPDHFAKTNFIKFIRNSSKIYPIQTFQIFPSCPLLSCIVWLFGLIAAASAGDRALVHNPRAVYEGLATWQTVYSRIWWNAQWLQNNCGGSVLWRGSLNVCNLEILRDLTHRRQNSAGLWRPGIEPRVLLTLSWWQGTLHLGGAQMRCLPSMVELWDQFGSMMVKYGECWLSC